MLGPLTIERFSILEQVTMSEHIQVSFFFFFSYPSFKSRAGALLRQSSRKDVTSSVMMDLKMKENVEGFILLYLTLCDPNDSWAHKFILGTENSTLKLILYMVSQAA